MKTHYSGGVVFASGSRLKGWAVCSTGGQASKIDKIGNHTTNKKEVTCKNCLALIKKQEDFKKEHFEIWGEYWLKGYCL